jgi:hypothetical protein
VRFSTGLTGIHDLALRSVKREGSRWLVSFAADGVSHDVEVEAQLGDLTRLTCNAPALQRPRHFVARAR